jgi:hypothetical protein
MSKAQAILDRALELSPPRFQPLLAKYEQQSVAVTVVVTAPTSAGWRWSAFKPLEPA